MRAIAFALALSGCAAATPGPAPMPPDDDEEPARLAVALRFAEAPDAVHAPIPQTRLVLVLIRDQEGARGETDLGVYPGACSHAAAGGPVLLSARCWWAGQGAVLDVMRRGDELVVRAAQVDEARGQGPFEVVAEVAIPEGATLHPIRPDTIGGR